MRIVFVTSRFPYPVEKGDKLRAFHQIRMLSKTNEVHLVALSHVKISDADMKAMEPYCTSIKVFQINRILFPLQLMMGWLEGLPLQVSYFLDRTIKQKVQYHIIRLEPEHVICQLIRAAPYVRSLPFVKTLDYMDVFSFGMRQLASKYGFFGFPFRWEANRLMAYERTIYKDFDKHTIISEQDRNRLSLASSLQVAVIPNGVDAGFSNFTKQHQPVHDVVFVGNLGYGPNKEAAGFLADRLLPLLAARGRAVKLLIAGARPGKKVLSLQQRKGVTIRGWMEDIRQAYSDGRIFVAPMFSGLGLQNKILEAMAMGLPCVTTSMVNNAIGAVPGKEILIADTLEGMAEHVEQLLRDPNLFSFVSANAGDFVRTKYTWEAQNKKLEDFIQSKNVYA